jgi:hypothetical protein
MVRDNISSSRKLWKDRLWMLQGWMACEQSPTFGFDVLDIYIYR